MDAHGRAKHRNPSRSLKELSTEELLDMLERAAAEPPNKGKETIEDYLAREIQASEKALGDRSVDWSP